MVATSDILYIIYIRQKKKYKNHKKTYTIIIVMLLVSMQASFLVGSSAKSRSICPHSQSSAASALPHHW